ncbi:MAG: thioredoxin family protein [Candidatus Bathyarchaeota archaeon]|nr:thioredoxin family protein [Candidatus Bathyarchaeota archaeon]
MSEIIDLQAEDWDEEVLRNEAPVIVDFWHHMCGWCLKLDPEFKRLPEAFENVKFAKMNILDSPENRKIAIESGVMGTPTIKVFCQGRIVGEIVGFRTSEMLTSDLNEILSQKEYCLEQSTPLE